MRFIQKMTPAKVVECYDGRDKCHEKPRDAPQAGTIIDQVEGRHLRKFNPIPSSTSLYQLQALPKEIRTTQQTSQTCI